VEVVTSVQRRRRWTPEQKLEIVKQTNEPGSSVSLVARLSMPVVISPLWPVEFSPTPGSFGLSALL
jgi:hypothetical protein